MSKELHLVLTNYWYDEIDSGFKKIEYRRNTGFWRRRILDKKPNIVTFHRAYTKRTISFAISKIETSDMEIQIHLGMRLNDGIAPVAFSK